MSFHCTNKSLNISIPMINLKPSTLAAIVQWIECWPENQRVSGLIPSQGTRLG